MLGRLFISRISNFINLLPGTHERRMLIMENVFICPSLIENAINFFVSAGKCAIFRIVQYIFHHLFL